MNECPLARDHFFERKNHRNQPSIFRGHSFVLTGVNKLIGTLKLYQPMRPLDLSSTRTKYIKISSDQKSNVTYLGQIGDYLYVIWGVFYKTLLYLYIIHILSLVIQDCIQKPSVTRMFGVEVWIANLLFWLPDHQRQSVRCQGCQGGWVEEWGSKRSTGNCLQNHKRWVSNQQSMGFFLSWLYSRRCCFFPKFHTVFLRMPLTSFCGT